MLSAPTFSNVLLCLTELCTLLLNNANLAKSYKGVLKT